MSVKPHVGLRRLLRLADHLDTVPRKSFDMRYWRAEGANCGTVSCAAGHACSIPSFRKAGLVMEYDYTMYAGLKVFMVKYKSDESFDALAQFFGISSEDAEFLFNPQQYNQYFYANITTKQVANRIRKYVERAKKRAKL